MRRKLFVVLLVLLCLIFVADFFKIPLTSPSVLDLDGKKGIFCGKVGLVKIFEKKVTIEVSMETFEGKKIKGKVLLTMYDEVEEGYSLVNKRISFRTTLKKPAEERNPHCFNYRKYLMSKDIWLVGTIHDVQIENKDSPNILEAYENILLEKRASFEKTFSHKRQGIIKGVLFGDTSNLDEEIYETFRSNGTSHILAVSGLHIGILYSVYKSINKRKKGWGIDIIFLFVIFSYGTLAMWSPSITRAIAMVVMKFVSKVADLRYDMLTSMSMIAILLIARNPYVIFGISFQLSFLAVTSIAFFRPIARKYLPDFIGTIVSVTVGLAFYNMYVFNYFSWVALFANIPIVYLAGYLIPFALITFATFSILGSSGPLQWVTEGTVAIVEKINHISALNGLGAIDVRSPELWIGLAITLTLFFLSSETYVIFRERNQKKKIAIIVICIFIVSIIGDGMVYNPISQDEIIFVDVGQGDCIHLRVNKKNILIDGGGSAHYNVGKKILKPYLLKNGVNQLDMVIATHLHTDHYRGLLELSNCYPIEKLGIYSGNRYLESKIRKEFRCDEVVFLEKNHIIKLGQGSYIKIIGPEKGEGIIEEKDENKNSLVMKIVCKDVSVIITGDISAEGERSTIEHNNSGEIDVDVLKISHHGSRFSSCPEFLDMTSPSVGIIQVGKNNYGHPTEEVLAELKERKIKVFRNDVSGAIGIRIKQGEIKQIHENIPSQSQVKSSFNST